MSGNVRTFARFLLVGAVNTAVGLSVTFALRHGLDLSYWPSTLAGLVAGAITSFSLNRKFTFRSDVPKAGAAFRFTAVVFLCYALAYEASFRLAVGLFAPLGLSRMHTEDLAVLLGTAVYTLLNYWGQKKIVFRPFA